MTQGATTDTLTSGNVTIPVIDFSLFATNTEECARQVGEASQNIGFFYLKNHGLPQDLIDKMFDTSENFFQRPLESKTKHMIRPDNTGYSPMKSETLDPETQTQGDLKEYADIINWAFYAKKYSNTTKDKCSVNNQILPSLSNGVDRAYNARKWSIDDDITLFFAQGDKDLQARIGEFYKGLHDLARNVMQCFAIALQVPEAAGGRHYFDGSHQWDAKSGTTLRFLHYPQQTGDPNTPLAGSHTDYGSITLLIQKDIAGLEVQASRIHKNVPWVAAPVIPNTILVNIGDHLQMWTNGLLRSTKHRVMYNPQQLNHSRYSIACFIHANDTTKLDPIPTPLITQEMRAEGVEFEEGRNMTAGEYLDWRLAQTYNFTAGQTSGGAM